ncbi:MAG: hypothetical protein ACRESK_01565, partial [Gammaproteobacteria bacterium]
MIKTQINRIDRRLTKDFPFLEFFASRPPGQDVRRPTWSLFVLIVFMLITVVSPQASAAENNAGAPDAKAVELAKSIAAGLQTASNRLDEIGKREDTRQLFIAGDKDALAAHADSLVGEFDSALKLRLLLPGQYDVDRESSPPLGYASLDLLRKSETSAAPVPAEIHGFGGANAHIVLVRRAVDAEQKLIGLLHLSLSPDPFIKLTGIENDYAELNQATDKGILIMNKAGNLGSRKEQPLKADIQGTRWHIAYWKGNMAASIEIPEIVESSLNGLPLLPMLLAVIIAGTAIAGYWYFRKTRSVSGEDAVKTVEATSEIVFGGAIKAIMEGKHPGLEKLIPELP